eukprot:6094943-Alexandrium_andersonii.AAC.1
MSASLVGSEMCIRDRSQSAQRANRPSPRRSESAKVGGPLSAGPSSGGAPVSYTHLTLPTICSV